MNSALKKKIYVVDMPGDKLYSTQELKGSVPIWVSLSIYKYIRDRGSVRMTMMPRDYRLLLIGILF